MADGADENKREAGDANEADDDEAARERLVGSDGVKARARVAVSDNEISIEVSFITMRRDGYVNNNNNNKSE
jgi:hypothetical protein